MLDSESNPTPDFSSSVLSTVPLERGALITGYEAADRFGLAGGVLPFLRMNDHIRAIRIEGQKPRYYEDDCREAREAILAGRIKLSPATAAEFVGNVGASVEQAPAPATDGLAERVEALEAIVARLDRENAEMKKLNDALHIAFDRKA